MKNVLRFCGDVGCGGVKPKLLFCGGVGCVRVGGGKNKSSVFWGGEGKQIVFLFFVGVGLA